MLFGNKSEIAIVFDDTFGIEDVICHETRMCIERRREDSHDGNSLLWRADFRDVNGRVYNVNNVCGNESNRRVEFQSDTQLKLIWERIEFNLYKFGESESSTAHFTAIVDISKSNDDNALNFNLHLEWSDNIGLHNVDFVVLNRLGRLKSDEQLTLLRPNGFGWAIDDPVRNEGATFLQHYPDHTQAMSFLAWQKNNFGLYYGGLFFGGGFCNIIINIFFFLKK